MVDASDRMDNEQDNHLLTFWSPENHKVGSLENSEDQQGLHVWSEKNQSSKKEMQL